MSFLDDFVTVSRAEDAEYSAWVKHTSANRVDDDVFFTNKLLELHPGHSIVVSVDPSLHLLSFPFAQVTPLPGKKLLSHSYFIPFARRTGKPGVVVGDIQYGVFKLEWDQHEFIMYIIKYPTGFAQTTEHFLLREGDDESPANQLLLAAGSFSNSLHEEILVFQQGWQKDHNMWLEIQKANWEDVILAEEFKAAIQGDITGFFDSQDIYKELAIPWKRGLIMYGPAGNGKTISLKAAMKSSPHPTLYVRSFQFWGGDEAAMQLIFSKAREMSPCMLVIEDLDSHINDRNRSFFLNQMDGLDDNDGLLLIGTTNHLERLDGSISNRPSRFDRKYLFSAPNDGERRQYAVYWQHKLKIRKSQVDFPDSLLDTIVEMTDGFSFAYLKEAFVSTLMLMAGGTTEGTFTEILITQIKSLKEQLEHGGQGSRVQAQAMGSFGTPATNHGTSMGRRVGGTQRESRMVTFARNMQTASAADDHSAVDIVYRF